ncbi:MAG: hypothetical protein HZA94_01590 [Candidatus Vogelbacteria bacterium]|nr:hypothetical protein [Candidatus Vogelbacteria bacterium]
MDIEKGRNKKAGIPFKRFIDDVPGVDLQYDKFLPSMSHPELYTRANHLGSTYDSNGKRRVNYREVEIAKKEFESLKKDYGVECSPRFVVGEKDDGSPAVFTIDDKVQGKNIVKDSFGEHEKEGIAPKLDTLFSSILDYLIKKYRDGSPMLADIEPPRQYMYNEKTGKIHLVDTDTLIYTNPGKDDILMLITNSLGFERFDDYDDDGKHLIKYEEIKGDDSIIKMEEKFKTTFTGFRDKLKLFADSISIKDRHDYRDEINIIETFLKNRPS